MNPITGFSGFRFRPLGLGHRQLDESRLSGTGVLRYRHRHHTVAEKGRCMAEVCHPEAGKTANRQRAGMGGAMFAVIDNVIKDISCNAI